MPHGVGFVARAVGLRKEDRVVFLGDYVDRGPKSREAIETLLGLGSVCSPVFLRGNHEVMILEACGNPLQAHLWQGYGGLETLVSYQTEFKPNWFAAIPDSHWEFFNRTRRFFETETHIFVHACLDPELDIRDQPDSLLFWEFFERLRPHKSGKRIVCGHTAQRSGEIKDVGFAQCIDTGAALGGWLTCLEVNSEIYWQANETGVVRQGSLGGL